ncbi:cytidine deaminase [Saccharopolyspora pogona]|uniref:cytidine deaminase n=1 Tax=Saccharopolyspora pogona TaxID=333966 RepID=UPI001682C878|nr:cytidine deaminase [Saccharopolyspora pogona]
MGLDQRLVDAAIELVERRWRNAVQAVAAAVRLDDGQILTSISLDNLNAAVTLCAETGALCQAYTLGKRVTASVCISKWPGSDGYPVLAPCGTCQERLALWGPGVQVAVADPGSPSGWSARTLLELNPFYWGTRFSDDGGWPSIDVHLS